MSYTKESKKTGPEVAERVRRMRRRWSEESPEGYDRETFAELKANLDRDRPSYRKLFAEESAGEESR